MRNVESRFATNPTSIDITRSTFDRSSRHLTSFNVGQLIPFYIDEVLPGDTFNVKTSKLVRLQTLLSPVMDNLYLDTYFFFVPNRLVWEHWKQFNGENTNSAWLPTSEYTVPQVTSPSGGWTEGTLADYFGVPTKVGNLSINALPFRGYCQIINDWFRDQNLQDPLNLPVNDSTIAGVNSDTFVTDCVKGGKPFIANKYHDYYSSCLKSPQKGPDVPLPLGDFAPVYTGLSEFDLTKWPSFNSTTKLVPGMYFKHTDTTGTLPDNADLGIAKNSVGNVGAYVSSSTSYSGNAVPSNLLVDLTSATGTSINQLRLAFQVQKLYEKDARGGTRYIEILKSHFGVTSPDARLQRSEYLGGNRLPITINQVINNNGVQNSESNTASNLPLGATAAYSLTVDNHADFTKSFTEHGFVIGLCVARYDHTYQQGLDRFWRRTDRFDYYWPVFQSIGEQAVLNSEIYAQGSSVTNPTTGNAYDDEVFGYQEAWADYRYKPNRVSGEMRSNATTPLDIWHYADDYSSLPSLSDSWIREDKSNVDRALAVQSSVSNQILADFFIANKTTRPMPIYSIPGLIDHH